MKKTIGSTILLFLSFTITGCAGSKVSNFGDKIAVGSSTAQVIGLLGQPRDIESNANNIVLKYCSTNLVVDEMLYIWLADNKVRQVVKDKNTRGGVCAKFLKSVKWEESLASNYLILQLSQDVISKANADRASRMNSFAETIKESNDKLYERQQEILSRPIFKSDDSSSTRLKANCLNINGIITCN